MQYSLVGTNHQAAKKTGYILKGRLDNDNELTDMQIPLFSEAHVTIPYFLWLLW